MRRVAAVTELFVEDAQKDLQDDIALILAVGLGVDVEQDHIGTALHRALNIREQHRVLDLVLVEELGGPFGATVLRVHRFDVLEQVGEDLDEVRLAGAEGARDPDGHPRRENRVLRVVGGSEEGVEKAAKYSVSCLVTTYSSSSCQMLSASRWSALITPLIGRSIGLVKRSLIFIVGCSGKGEFRQRDGRRDSSGRLSAG
jgi:hypothetical protein